MVLFPEKRSVLIVLTVDNRKDSMHSFSQDSEMAAIAANDMKG